MHQRLSKISLRDNQNSEASQQQPANPFLKAVNDQKYEVIHVLPVLRRSLELGISDRIVEDLKRLWQNNQADDSFESELQGDEVFKFDDSKTAMVKQ